jgi:phospholipid N-methyltransferase
VAAIALSSAALARLITSEIELADAPVIELGPRTDVFTRALLAGGLAQEGLTLVEYGAGFIPALRNRFPAARIFHADADRLGRLGLLPGARQARWSAGWDCWR